MPLADRVAAQHITPTAPDFHLVLTSAGGTIRLTHLPAGPFVRIGSAPGCDWLVQMAGLAPWHATLHFETSHIWIEAAGDVAVLEIGGQAVSRGVITASDLVSLGNVSLSVRSGRTIAAEVELPSLSAADDASEMEMGDLSELSAEALCDLLVNETAMIAEHEAAQARGWQDLLAAVEATARELLQPATEIDSVLQQVRSLTTRLDHGTEQLLSDESTLADSTRRLEQSQERLGRQVDAVIGQLSSATPGELRASA